MFILSSARKDEKEGEAMMEKGEDFLEEYSEPIQEAATPLLSVGEFVQHPEGNTQYQIQRVVTVQG
jgi:hypothetical protein